MWPGRKLFWAVLGTAALILSYQLFVPPIAGLADQGDFIRTIGRFGYGPSHHGALRYIYVEPSYIPDPHYRSQIWEQANAEYLFVGAALLLNKLISASDALDIRVAGFVHAAAFLAAFARLLWVTRQDRARTLIWIASLAILTDAGYAVYFNSFYAEPASCVFFLLLLAETLDIAGRAEPGWASAARWSLWAILWVFAKPQNAPVGLLLGLFSFRLALWIRPPAARAIPVVGAFVIFGCVAYHVMAMPVVGHLANTYGMVFAGILADSKDPGGDLRALGLDPTLAKYAGSGAWTSVTAFPQLAASGELMRKVNTFTVVRFYLLHPARAWRRLHAALPKITLLRWYWYGNYEPSSGYLPAAQSRAFSLWSWFHERAMPPFGKWLVFALAVWPVACAWRWVRARDPLRRRRLELETLLPLGCLAALLGAVFGDAFDLVKHCYSFNLLLDACLVYAAAWIAGAAGFWGRAPIV